MENKFKIGDKVNEIFSGLDYVIIADKQTPYDHIAGKVYPLDNNDYVLRRIYLEPNKFVPFTRGGLRSFLNAVLIVRQCLHAQK